VTGLTQVNASATVAALQAHSVNQLLIEDRGMPSSAVHSFTDPDEYAASVAGGTVDLTITARGNFSARLTRIDLHRLRMQRLFDNLPRIAEATNIISSRAYISFRTRPGPSLVQAGTGLRPSAVLQHGRAHEYYQRSSGPADLGTMSLPIEDLAALGEAMAAADLTPPPEASLVTPSPSAMAKLQRLHAAAGRLAEDAPEVIAHPDAARGLEQALIEAMVDCLASREVRENTLAQGQHAIVMRRFRRLVGENEEHPLYIPEICNAIGVSSRTLQACCHEHLGMGPKHYLLLRRMHLARRALREAAPDAESVTEIATRYGFWQLGRFAVEYQSLFGESPSATLRRAPD
jgi:AraC-like DNA-binding protein